MNKSNPGSPDALFQGCTCPLIDNHYGRGVPSDKEPLFWYTEGCPVHDENQLSFTNPNVK